jgi:hypothetical protein
VKDLVGTGRDGHEAKKCKKGADDDGDIGKTSAGGDEKDFGSVSSEGKTVYVRTRVRIVSSYEQRLDLQRARELVYKSLDAADHAEVKRHALMTEGKPLMPDLEMAMTKGEAAAVPVLDWSLKLGSLDGTSKPMMNVPKM